MGETSKHEGDEPVGLPPVEPTESQDKFKEPVPVESIIPGIRGDISTVEEQADERRAKKDRCLADSFWGCYINKVTKRKLGKDTPSLFDTPGVVKGKSKKETLGLELFKDQVVVDLGAGATPAGYLLSELLRARAYVGVELYNYGSLEILMRTLSKNKRLNMGIEGDIKDSPDFYKHNIPYSIVPSDILSFLRRLPDDSVSILMGGIDTGVISDDSYRRQIFEEIKRVLSKDGGFLCQQSNPPAELKLEVVHNGHGDCAGGDYIFRKPREK
jgi:SAM-dependent methyltransferase